MATTVQAVLAPAATCPEAVTTARRPASTPLAADRAAPFAARAARSVPDATADAASPAVPATPLTAFFADSAALPVVLSAADVALDALDSVDVLDPAVEVFRFAFLFCSVMDTGLPQRGPANTSGHEAALTVSGVNGPGAAKGSQNSAPRRAAPAFRG